MRIAASSYPGTCWLVWHVPTCLEVKHVLWVDTEARTYCQHIVPLQVIGGEVASRVVHARQIAVNVDAALILIDPVEDATDEQRTAVMLIPRPQPVNY